MRLSAIIIALFMAITGCSKDGSSEKKEPLRFVVTGHTYPMQVFLPEFKTYLDSIVADRPDFLYVLGDMVKKNDPQELKSNLDPWRGLPFPTYFAAGNHDINYQRDRDKGITKTAIKAKEAYREEVGYLYHFHKDEYANYLLINSNDPIDSIRTFLKGVDWRINPDLPTFLMAHHMVWNKSYAKDQKTWPKKGFQWKELMPMLWDVDYIIAGDWTLVYDKKWRGWWWTVLAGIPVDPNDLSYVLVEIGDSIKVTQRSVELLEDSKWLDKWRRSQLKKLNASKTPPATNPPRK